MNADKVSLNLLSSAPISKQSPQIIILPKFLAKPLGIERRLVLNSRTQQIPAAVLGWLRNDARYSGWFAEAHAVASPGAQVMTLDAQTAAGTVNPDGTLKIGAGVSVSGTLANNGEPIPQQPADDGEPVPPNAPDEGAGKDGGKAEVDPNERWRADWLVPALREYVARHNVELPAKAVREDVLKALAEQRGEFEDTSEPEPKSDGEPKDS